MSRPILLSTVLILLISFETWAQTPGSVPAAPAPADTAKEEKAGSDSKKPNSKRIRRQLNLIVGVEHDEEFLIPDIEILVGGRTDFFDIERIKGTDYFRITPKKTGSGITTLKDAKTKQII